MIEQRAVLEDERNIFGQATLAQYSDYYPFGSLLPGRSLNPTNYRYSYQTQEQDHETGYHNFQLRQYASLLGRWMSPDPYGQHHSPYLAMNNNPVSFIDPDGGQDCADCSDPTSTSYFDRWQREGLEDFYGTELLQNNPYLNGNYYGITANNQPRDGIGMMREAAEAYYNNPENRMGHYDIVSLKLNIPRWLEGNDIGYYALGHDVEIEPEYQWVSNFEGSYWGQLNNEGGTTDFGNYNLAQGGGGCPNCLNPATVGQQFFGIGGLTYPGGNNPKSYNGQYNYSYVPTNLSEYPAIGHDRRYDNLKITGASGLFTDTRAIGADWRFVAEELSIAGNPFFNPIDRMSAGLLGVGLGLSALPKTLFQLSKPFGYMQTIMWYNISNQGVNNAPTIHKH